MLDSSGLGGLKKALEFFAGMVRRGATHRREQKITVSEGRLAGATERLFKGSPDRRDWCSSICVWLDRVEKIGDND